MEQTLEIATFRAEITPEFLACRDAAMDAIAREFDGFISERLVQHDDGSLSDLIVWSSRSLAKDAAAKASSLPEAAAYFAMFTASISMEHAEIVGS